MKFKDWQLKNDIYLLIVQSIEVNVDKQLEYLFTKYVMIFLIILTVPVPLGFSSPKFQHRCFWRYIWFLQSTF